MRKKLISCTVALLTFASASMAGDTQPNIIVILNDDQGYQDLGCYGSPDIKTPRIDAMAAEGMKFTDFYVASPVCSASRAALLTGCYPNRVGVPKVFFPNRGPKGMDTRSVTIAEMLKAAGYKTMAVGKWHLGHEDGYLPTRRGFDSYYGIPYSNDMTPAKSMNYAKDCLFREGVTKAALDKAFANNNSKAAEKKFNQKVPLMRDEECIEFPVDQTTITQRYASEGIEFITASVEERKPFFLYLANSMPHVPLYASPDFKGKSKRGPYGDAVEEIDHNVGRILDCLKQLKIEDNTVIVFTSDNGPWLVKGEDGGSALPLFEGKHTNFDGGQRVPAIMRWPGRIPAGSVCTELATTMDLLPTFAHIAGADLPTVMPLDGHDILDLISAKSGAKTPYEFFYFGDMAVRSGDWKYHSKQIYKATERDYTGPALYNLKDDIGESRNVMDQYPEITARLKRALENNPNVKNGSGSKKKK